MPWWAWAIGGWLAAAILLAIGWSRFRRATKDWWEDDDGH